MFRVSNLTFQYHRGEKRVLNGVNFSLEKGKIGVLLGPNGAGKTTLLKCILGLVRIPGQACIELDAEKITEMPERKRAQKIAYVPQDIRFGEMSVYDTVLMGRVSRFGLRPGKSDHEAATQVIKEMGLERYANRNIMELSGGERQKAAIARALAQEPQMLVFDEPTGNLDIANGQMIAREARRLAREKEITVLCSLHDFNQAIALADRFFLMKDGVIQKEGGSDVLTQETLEEIFGIRVTVAEIGGRRVIF